VVYVPPCGTYISHYQSLHFEHFPSLANMSQILFLPLVYRSIHAQNQNRIKIFKAQGLCTTNI